MKGDFSRFTFDPSKHYGGVLHQQGRVWLDSDWNEEVMERLFLLQQELRDVIGPSGTPAPGSGFQLSPSTNPNAPDDFGVSAGHCYVNGTLCQLEADTSYLSQPDLLDPPRVPMPTGGATVTALVYLEVWQRLISYLEDDSIREIALGGPDTSTRLKNVVQMKVGLLPSGIGNITCAQAAQFLPGPGSGTLTTLQPTNLQPQSLCQLPDPANFTGRENHLYRVQVHDAGDVSGLNTGGAFSVLLAADVAVGATTLRVLPALTAAQIDAASRSGFVTVSDNAGASERAPLALISTDGSTLTLAQGLTNAYSTANSASVTGGIARFKWSRENAAFAVSVANVQPDRQTLTLVSLGRDVATALRQGDLVEITDDSSDLGPARGHLTTLASDPDPDKFTAVLTDPIPGSFQLPAGTGSPPSLLSGNRHMVLRRWDGIGDAFSTYGDATTPGMNLGDGVHIQFGGQDLRAGDYWQFTARTTDGSVQALLNALPAGVNRSRTPLAIVTWGPPPPTSPPSSPPPGTVAMTILNNCLPVFPALTNFPPIDQGIHIVGLTAVDGANNVSQLSNDTNVTITSFAGINIQCDANVDPVSISRPTCFVTLEFPINFSDGSQNDAYFPIVLAGSVSTAGSVISWKAGPQAQTVLNQLVRQALNERGVLAHLTLKGNFIWSQNDPTLFLDGEVFGRPPGGASSNVSLRLPSGDRRRGGNFDMWFWLVAAPSFITALQANPPGPINVGDTTTIIMTLSSPAPPNSVIALTINNSNVSVSGETPVTSPPTSPPSFTLMVPVAAGATTATVQAKGVAQGSTTIGASFGGQSVALTLIVQPPPVLTGQLVLNPPSVFVGNSAQGQVTLSGPAPSTGLVVNLATNNSSVARLSSSSVTVPAGSTTATFGITGVSEGTATITASAGTTLSALFTVTSRKSRIKDVKDSTKETAEKAAVRETIQDVGVKGPADTKLRDTLPSPSPASTVLPSLVAASPGIAHSQAFIRPEERPPVGEAVLNPPVEPEPSVGPADIMVAPPALAPSGAAQDSGAASREQEQKPPQKRRRRRKGPSGKT